MYSTNAANIVILLFYKFTQHFSLLLQLNGSYYDTLNICSKFFLIIIFVFLLIKNNFQCRGAAVFYVFLLIKGPSRISSLCVFCPLVVETCHHTKHNLVWDCSQGRKEAKMYVYCHSEVVHITTELLVKFSTVLNVFPYLPVFANDLFPEPTILTSGFERNVYSVAHCQNAKQQQGREDCCDYLRL